MKPQTEFWLKFALMMGLWCVWWWTMDAKMSSAVNMGIIIGGPLLTFPFIWLARRMLDKDPTAPRAVRMTTLVHYSLGILFGMPIIRALVTHAEWAGWTIPVPYEVGLMMVVVSGAATLLTVLNLALKGLGAPFAIALSQQLAMDWFYAWTRNPMVLAVLALLVSLGLWYRSGLFVLWTLVVYAPALLFFVKVFEERELELRFGDSYRAYRAGTPMLLPRPPKG